jgi:hypothetical protein
MDRFAASSGADRQVQPVRSDDVTLPIGDVTSAIRPAPLSAPNIPSVMDDPRVRAAMAGFATSPAANGHVQPVGVADPRITIAPPSLSAPNIPSTTAGPLDDENSRDENAKASSSTVWDYLDAGARWAPVLGPVLDLGDDYKEGNLWKGALDAGFLASDLAGGWLLKAPAKAALKGLVKGAWKEELKPYWKMGSHSWAATRKEYGKVNELTKGMPVHHWLIPQRWQRDLPWLFPESLTNQPWNLLPMSRASEAGTTPRLLHDAIEGKGKQNFQFDPNNALRDYYLRFKYGTPDWAKVGIPAAVMSAGGNTAEAGNAIYNYLYGTHSSKQ